MYDEIPSAKSSIIYVGSAHSLSIDNYGPHATLSYAIVIIIPARAALEIWSTSGASNTTKEAIAKA